MPRRAWLLPVLLGLTGCYNPDSLVYFLVDRPSEPVLEAITYQETTLSDVLASPRLFHERGATFLCRFHGSSSIYNPGYTVFGEIAYQNFSAWSPDASLWDPTGYAGDVPFFYVDRRKPGLFTDYEDLEAFDLVEVDVRVYSPFGDRAYFQVDEIRKRSSGPITLEALRNAHRALTAERDGRWEEGVLEAQAALRSPVPPGAHPHLRRALGHCLLELGRIEEAHDQLSEASRNLGEDLELLRWEGRAAHALGRGYRGVAVDFLERAVRKNPSDPEILLLLADAYDAAGRPEDALSQARRACELAQRPESLETLARLEAGLGHFEEACTAHQAALAMDPSLWRAWIALAKTQIRLDRMEDALASFTRGIEAGGELVAADDRFLAARTALARREHAKARAWLEVCLRTPGWEGAADAHASLAAVALAEGDPKGAVVAINAALALEPDNPRFLTLAGAFRLGCGDAAGAVEAFRSALARGADQPDDVEEGLASACLALGDLDGAAKAIARACRLKETPRRCLFQGEIAWMRGKPEDSERAHARSIELDPTSIQAYMGRSRALSQLGRHEAARRVLGDALARDPENPRLLALSALAALRSGAAPSEALGPAEKAFARAPKDPDCAHAYGWALLASDRPGDAVPVLRVAVDAGDVPEVDLHYAQALAASGRPAEARPILERLASSTGEAAQAAAAALQALPE